VLKKVEVGGGLMVDGWAVDGGGVKVKGEGRGAGC